MIPDCCGYCYCVKIVTKAKGDKKKVEIMGWAHIGVKG